jgi:hypothetical protein
VKLVTKIRNELEGENKYKRVRLSLCPSLLPIARSPARSHTDSYALPPPAPPPCALSHAEKPRRGLFRLSLLPEPPPRNPRRVSPVFLMLCYSFPGPDRFWPDRIESIQ